MDGLAALLTLDPYNTTIVLFCRQAEPSKMLKFESSPLLANRSHALHMKDTSKLLGRGQIALLYDSSLVAYLSKQSNKRAKAVLPDRTNGKLAL